MQADEDVRYKWSWEVRDIPTKERIPEHQIGLMLFLNGKRAGDAIDNPYDYESALLEKMKYALKQQVYWRIEMFYLRYGYYPEWTGIA
jgi:hypothetical protein